MNRVLIADDHPIMLSGLEAVLRGTQYQVELLHWRRGRLLAPKSWSWTSRCLSRAEWTCSAFFGPVET
jgi:hypothetical protein